MSNIRAPFNFVPLSDKVYFPEWGGRISQDIPFSDGVSGVINLTITAQTPIFVRNGHSKEDAEQKNATYKSFSKTPDGRYFIPGSSIKGAVRNVMEIMSFCKMRLDDSAMFSHRDMNGDLVYSTFMKSQQKLHCGYLKVNGVDENGNETYILEDHGKPYRIGHDQIDKLLGSCVFRNHFSIDSHFDLNKEEKIGSTTYDPKTATYKYALIGKDKSLKGLTFSEHNSTTEHSTRLEFDSNGNIKGDIVLTGQPNLWKWPRPVRLDPKAGKFYEFVFSSEFDKTYRISSMQFRHFQFIYAESAEWKRAKKLLNNSGIPVFFRPEKNGIKDFGLAYLYKLPYDHSAYGLLSENHKKDNHDLVECIFGYTGKRDSLKSRVIFGNAVSENAIESEELRLVLGSPKASYYPIYIEQDGRNGVTSNYKTYDSGRISGWKRYHVRKISYEKSLQNDKLDTLMCPLSAGTQFKGRIIFHNLKDVELGALLSALTFHNTDGCYHQIGQGKPYGLGKVTITIDDNTYAEKTLSDYMAIYERQMSKAVGTDWVQCQQVKNLFAMSHEEVDNQSQYEYMVMSNKRPENEFLMAKAKGEYLQRFEALINKGFAPKSLYAEYKEQQAKLQEEKAKEEEKAREAADKKSIELKNLADEAFKANDVAKALSLYKESESLGGNCALEISKCENKLKAATMGIMEIIKINPNSKIPTAAGQIKKYINTGRTISVDDCCSLGRLLNTALTNMKKAEKSKWIDYKNWKPIIDIIGEELTKKIYSFIEQ